MTVNIAPVHASHARLLLGWLWLAASATAAVPAAGETPLRIVTFNAHCLAAPETRDSRLARFRWDAARRAHLEQVASLVETLEPDVMSLLEVTSAPAVEMLIDILHEKGLNQYHGYHVESEDKFSGFDVAFISRTPADTVEDQTIRMLYSPSGDDLWRETYSFTDEQSMVREGNTALNRHAVFYVTIAGHKLGFLGLHLKADPSDDYSNSRRTAEAQIARRIVRSEIVARGYTPIVLGDLNDYDPDVPDRDESRSTKTRVIRVLKNYDMRQRGDELVNTGDKIVRIADRYTSHWDINENGAADVEDVYTTIDYILLHKSLVPYVHRTFVSRLTDLKTSDHWPLVVDLQLPKLPGRDPT